MLSNEILQIIDGLNKSNNVETEYQRVFTLCNLIFKNLSSNQNDINTFHNNNIYEIFDAYIDLYDLLKASKQYVDNSIGYIDTQYKDNPITTQLQNMQNEYADLNKVFESTKNKHLSILAIKEEIDTITPQITKLQNDIDKYKSLDATTLRAQKEELDNEIKTKYQDKKALLLSIEEKTKEREKILQNIKEKEKDKKALLSSIDEKLNEEIIISRKIEEEKSNERDATTKVEAGKKLLESHQADYKKLADEIKKYEDEITIYSKHLKANQNINLLMKNETNKKLLKDIETKLNDSDELITKYMKIQEDIKEDIDKRKKI